MESRLARLYRMTKQAYEEQKPPNLVAYNMFAFEELTKACGGDDAASAVVFGLLWAFSMIDLYDEPEDTTKGAMCLMQNTN